MLITLDAVGGVWRYSIDLAAGLVALRRRVSFAGFGPSPTAAQRAEVEALGPLDWAPQALDWMARGPQDVAGAGRWLSETAARRGASVLQCNLPSLAAKIPAELPVVAVSHSCLAGWFKAVRDASVPREMRWIHRLTAAGLARADAIVAPSASHAAEMRRHYDRLGRVDVVRNAATASMPPHHRARNIVAAGRWWDESKDGATLDAAARECDWPVFMLGPDQGPNGARIDIRAAVHLGQLRQDEAAERIAGAGIFVSPSIYEPFGLAVLEAARAGAPLVLADIPTFRELWSDAAVFVPPRDHRALAKVLNDLAADDPRRAKLGEAACARAGRYSAKAQARAMAAIHDRVHARMMVTHGAA